MPEKDLPSRLRFYFIVDCDSPLPLIGQVETALLAGATMVQYRNKQFAPDDFETLETIRHLCRTNGVPFIVNDDIVLARAIDADGVHLGQSDEDHALARKILGRHAIVGASVSTLDELSRTRVSNCDYIGTGPVFHTGTKADASPVIGTDGLSAVVRKAPVPVVAIGGIDARNARLCLSAGASGVAVISTITRASDPFGNALALGEACECPPRHLKAPWKDEFDLIERMLSCCTAVARTSAMKVFPGDDAALFSDIENPVFTTDTQREGVHFRRFWQTMDEIGKRAVEITFSDLAASYAKPVGLFVNLCIPAETAEADILSLYRGIDHQLSCHGAVMAGGNLSLGRVLSLDLFAAGTGGGFFPLRSAAKPGDGLYVTGPIGLARSGLECLSRGDMSFPGLIEKFKFPTARFDAAAVLADEGVACVMDISDGLYGDAGHIARASNVSVRFDPGLFVIDPEVAAFCEKYDFDPASQILAGGDDYELLFTCRPEVFETISARLPGAFQVGSIVPQQDHLCTGAPDGIMSYRHGVGK